MFEETGVELGTLCFVGVTNNVFASGEHSISIYFEAECVDAGALVATPDEKCKGWSWQHWEAVDGDLFLPLKLLRQTGYKPFAGQNPATGLKSWNYI